MAFRIKDLLIVALPKEWDIAEIGFDPGSVAASPGPGPVSPGPPDSDIPVLDPMDLVELRMMMQLILTRLGGPLTLGEMQPRSNADLEDLESRLSEALEEVRTYRSKR